MGDRLASVAGPWSGSTIPTIEEPVLRGGDRIAIADSEFIVSTDGEDGEILPVPEPR